MTPPPVQEIDTLDALTSHLATQQGLRGSVVQSLDLRGLATPLSTVDVQGALFLGCTFPDDLDEDLRRRGALLFPSIPDMPFNPYQPQLYRADELYDALPGHYSDCRDATIHAWQLARAAQPALADTLAMALHDHAISDGIDDWFAAHPDVPTVGIMGGHAALRGSDSYRRAAQLAGSLTRAGRLVATGGGPGAMEAGNLGAWLAHSPEVLDEAIALLATAPDFHTDIDGWALTAAEVRRRWPATAESLGIPTWFYGHEPPNQFGTGIAKYFSNAIREDILLQRCRGGIVYLEGAAGTVQEIFQAATGTYYAAPGVPTTPMVLVGIDHWTRRLPAWPLLQALGEGREMGTRLHLVDTVEQAAELLL